MEIAREKPLPFKPSGNGFGGKGKGGRGGRRGMTVEIVIAVAMVAVMTSRKAVVETIVLIKTNGTVIKDNKNLATLQAKRRPALLFVTKETNRKKRFTV